MVVGKEEGWKTGRVVSFVSEQRKLRRSSFELSRMTYHRITLKNRSSEEILGLGARKKSSDHLSSARLSGDGDFFWVSSEAGEGLLKEGESVDNIPDGQVLVRDTGRRKKSQDTEGETRSKRERTSASRSEKEVVDSTTRVSTYPSRYWMKVRR